jgi:uncharacterized DUF497 family protein
MQQPRYNHDVSNRFEWDEEKNRANKLKHGLSFEEAIAIFDDPHLLTVQDRMDGFEQRWKSIGVVRGVLLILAIHTVREETGDEVIRIISARYAERQDRRMYEEGEGR